MNLLKSNGYYLSSEKLYYTLKDKMRIFEWMTSNHTIDEMKATWKNSLEFRVHINEMYNVFENNERYEYLSTLNDIKN